MNENEKEWVQKVELIKYPKYRKKLSIDLINL